MNLFVNLMCYILVGSKIVVGLVSNDKGLEFSVGDNGLGILEVECFRVLECFYWFDKSRMIEGFGFGLSMVKVISELYYVEIELVNNVFGFRVGIVFLCDGEVFLL